ncbi:DNA polymerase epsilon subunit 3 [Dermatophagoides farinae]|uniref:DNA polymerase epsilon subunit 3 n=1 Tax=Dermatophagoides farinae TaxID=6954 RepID=A0A922HWA5_DERFA|nr:DNA polymerase epsilon subunit 3-like [Dermatophagoides farinae]KAH7643864.1 histone h2a-like protein [Dermatophagoides farinae]KAH9497104.1 Sequence-specific DNA binding [Dermatophagoides farinae]KAH9510424.1 Sequence-specific DNA binding [Dermatophagoides farinae]
MAGNSDFTIPLNVVTKIIAESLPEESTVTVEQDFIKALARAAHLFILYSTTRASEMAIGNNRRTVHPQDVLSAISFYGFDHLIPKLISWHRTYVDEKQRLKSKRTIDKKSNAEATTISSDQMEVEIITNDLDQSETINDGQFENDCDD